MNEVFLKVLNMSIAASWLILAVMLLRLALKRAPKWIAVALWGIVALRLAVPFSFESAWSLIPSAETFSPHNIQYETPAISSGIPAVNHAVNPVLGEAFAPNPVGGVNPLYVWTFVVSVIWLMGIAAMLLYAVISYVRVHRSVAERVPYGGNIFLCDHVKSPFILGLVRPKIYLPSGMESAAMEPVIAHEKAHLTRHDHWWKPMGFLILAVHWFNPLCWIAYVLLCRDIELACDEKVIRQMDLDGKKQYSTALLECDAGRRLVTICPLAFGEVGVKERVKNVLNYKKPAFWVIVLAAIACAVVTVCFATNPEGSRTFSMAGRNVSDLEPQKMVEEIARIENLESGSGLYVNADNFGLQLTSDFDWENDGAISFFYVKGKETLSAQLRLFTSEQQFFVTEHSNWPDQNRIFSLPHYLNALKYLPKEQIRKLSPDADSYQVLFRDGGIPKDYDNVVTYSSNGVGSIDGWLIHLEVQPFHDTPSPQGETETQATGAGSEIIHLFYGSQGTMSGQRLTLDDVVMLSQKGDTLTWSDFERYQGRDIGSGLYIMQYRIDELFDVLVGGVPDEEPMYIYLRVNTEADDHIDIRTKDVLTFIETHRNDVPKVVEPKPNGGGEAGPDEPDFSTLSAEQAAVHQAILAHNRSTEDPDGLIHCASFAELACLSGTPLAGDSTHKITYYGWALYQEYQVTDRGLEAVCGSHIPVAISFDLDESRYTLTEYWQPRDGGYYAQDIREKFPSHIVEDGGDSQKFILQQKQACYAQAVESAGLDTNKVIGTLMETICGSPAQSSNPGDYIKEHSIDYRELTYYGRYTLEYCFDRFEKGDETGLDGHIMMLACEDTAAGWGESLNLEVPAGTGQEWYNAFKSNALNLMEQCSAMELAQRYPASYLLLSMLGEV